MMRRITFLLICMFCYLFAQAQYYYVNDDFDTSTNPNWTLDYQHNNAGAHSFENGEMVLSTEGGSDGYFGIFDIYHIKAVYDNLPQDYTNKTIAFNIREIERTPIEDYKDGVAFNFSLEGKADSTMRLAASLQGNHSGYDPDGALPYNSYNKHRLYIWKNDSYFGQDNFDNRIVVEELSLDSLYNYHFKFVHNGTNWDIYYKEDGAADFIKKTTDFTKVQDLELNVGIGTGDGGITRKNAKGKFAMDYLKVYDNIDSEYELTVDKNKVDTNEVVTFNYRIPSAAIGAQLHYDYGKKITLTDTSGSFTHIYEYPGFFRPTIIFNNKGKITTNVQVLSCGWFGYVEPPNQRRKNEVLCDFVQGDGRAYIAPSMVNISSSYWTNFENIQDFNHDGDETILEARIKIPANEGGISCYDPGLYMYGELGTAFIRFMQPGCQFYSGIGAGNSWNSSSNTSTDILQPLTGIFSDWVTLKFITSNDTIKAYYNDELRYTLAYEGAVGMVQGLRFRAKGSGSIDWIKLSKSDGTLVYEENFDDCNLNDDETCDRSIVGGDEIYFVSPEKGSERRTIWVADMDGNIKEVFSDGAHRLAFDIDSEQKKLYYIKTLTDLNYWANVPIENRPKQYICSSDLDGSNEEVILTIDSTEADYARFITVDKGNGKLAINMHRWNTGQTRDGDIFIYNPSNQEFTNVTNNYDTLNHRIRFDNTGENLFYTSNETQFFGWPQNLHRVDLTSLVEETIIDNTGFNNGVSSGGWPCDCVIYDLSMSPSGEKVLYTRGNGGGIWTANLDGSEATKLPIDLPDGATVSELDYADNDASFFYGFEDTLYHVGIDGTSIHVIPTASNTYFSNIRYINNPKQDDELTFILNNTEAAHTSTAKVPVTVKSFEDVLGYSFSISLSDTLAGKITAVSAGVHEPQLVNQISDTEVLIAWNDPSGSTAGTDLADSTIIFYVDVALAGNPGTCSDIRFSESPLELSAVVNVAGEYETIQPKVVHAEVCVLNEVVKAGNIQTESMVPVQDVRVSCNDSMQVVYSDEAGDYMFEPVPGGADYTVSAFKDGNDRNGIRLIDVILIQQHYLENILLDSPYKLVAADVNNDCKINVIDESMTRRIFGFVDTAFTAVNSWRFIPKSMSLDSTSDACHVPYFDEVAYLKQLNKDSLNIDFVAVKSGDVTQDALGTRSIRATDFVYELQEYQGKLMYAVYPAHFNEKTYGFQLSLAINGEKARIHTPNLTGEAIQVLQKNQALIAWYHPTGQTLNMAEYSEERPLFYIEYEGRLASLQLLDHLDVSELYDARLKEVQIRLRSVESKGLELYPSHPNPFVESTWINFSLTTTEQVQIELFDLLGNKLFESTSVLKSGNHGVQLDAHLFGSAGTYFYRIQAGNQSITRSIIKIQ